MEHKLCGEAHAHEKLVQTKRRAANAILSSKGKKDASNLDLKIRKIHILWCSSSDTASAMAATAPPWSPPK